MPKPVRPPAVATGRPVTRRPATRRSAAASRARAVALGVAVAGLVLTAGGCLPAVDPPKAIKLVKLPPPTDLPDFMGGSIRQYAVTQQLDTANVSGYGLVGQLRGTGSSKASNTVRGYMWKEMVRRGFDNSTIPGYGKLTPADVFADPRFAIVRVDAYIPPGAREGDWIDARVTALPEPNETTSLVHGMLFETDLKESGADRPNPAGAITTLAVVKGPIMVNPVYALDNPLSASPAAQESLRSGTVMYSAIVKHDRPIMLQLRDPQGSTARQIQAVVNERFQTVGSEAKPAADAKSETIVELLVPKAYRGNYQHFVKVVEHLYLQRDTSFKVKMAQRLAAEAVKPDAKLEDIAYAWEGLGARSLDAVRPLLIHPNPDVAYWAARAAAFIGDPTQAAESRLMQMAASPTHPYRLAAVKTLGELPPSAALNTLLRRLLDSEMTLIRTEAYQILARPRDRGGDPDTSIIRTFVRPPGDAAANREFILDVVPGNGPPLVYAVRNGVPRVALIGRVPAFVADTPLTVMAEKLTLASREKGRAVLLYFRDYKRDDVPIQAITPPRLDRLIETLGGAREQDPLTSLNFTYGEVVAILQKLVDANKLVAQGPKGEELLASLVIREPDRIEADLINAPILDAPGGPGGLRPPPGALGPPRAAADAAPGGGRDAPDALRPPPEALRAPTGSGAPDPSAPAADAYNAPRFGSAVPVAPSDAAAGRTATGIERSGAYRAPGLVDQGPPPARGSNAPAFGAAPVAAPAPTEAAAPPRQNRPEASNAPKF
jgi:flagellar basal body P-ring protein FlgI